MKEKDLYESPFLQEAYRLSDQFRNMVIDNEKQAVFAIAVEMDGDRMRVVTSAAFKELIFKDGLVSLFKESMGSSVESAVSKAIIEYKTWKLAQIMNVNNLINNPKNDEQYNN